eukprot:1161406-Pelagomonas_calceolata.AAC.1
MRLLVRLLIAPGRRVQEQKESNECRQPCSTKGGLAYASKPARPDKYKYTNWQPPLFVLFVTSSIVALAIHCYPARTVWCVYCNTLSWLQARLLLPSHAHPSPCTAHTKYLLPARGCYELYPQQQLSIAYLKTTKRLPNEVLSTRQCQCSVLSIAPHGVTGKVFIRLRQQKPLTGLGTMCPIAQ